MLLDLSVSLKDMYSHHTGIMSHASHFRGAWESNYGKLVKREVGLKKINSNGDLNVFFPW